MRRYKATIKAGRGLSEVWIEDCGFVGWWATNRDGWPLAGPCSSERKLRAEVAALRRRIASGEYAPRVADGEEVAHYGEVEWRYLCSAWAYSKRVYIRDGEVYTLSIKVPPLYKGKEVPLVLCEEHKMAGVAFAPSPEIWEEVAPCGECYALTVAQSPGAVRRRPSWPFRVEGLQVEGRNT